MSDDLGRSDRDHIIAADLRRSFDALSRGDLTGWLPLSLDARRRHLELAVGSSVEPVSTPLFGQPAEAWRWPPSSHLPTGAVVWLQRDQVVLVDIDNPDVTVPVTESIGPPDEVMWSGLGRLYEQWLYPTRGLVAHVTRGQHRIRLLLGLEAMTLDVMRVAPITTMTVTRVHRFRA